MVWNASGVHDFYDPPTDWTPLATTAAYSTLDNLGKSYSYRNAIEDAKLLSESAAKSAMTRSQGIENASLFTTIGGLANTAGSFVGAGLANDLFGGDGVGITDIKDYPISGGWRDRISWL
tara:strand:+ start:679 stop:1038 length:360 start_codon:yes stop_codon:yes gene_type:complete